MTAASKRWLSLVHRLPCVVCLECFGRRRMAQEAHHVESVRDEHSDFAVVSLCAECHESIHRMHRREFHRVHKTDDIRLLAWTNQAIEKLLWETGRKVA